MKNWEISLVITIGLATSLTGCGNNSQGGFSKRIGGANANTLRYALATSPTTLDPAKAQDIETIDILSNVYAPLVDYDETNEIIGALAKSWTTEENGKKYKFVLNAAQFSDGSPITSEDVKTSWERALNIKIGSATAETYLGDIVGAKDVLSGKVTTLSGVVVTGPQTFEVTLDQPKPYFLGKLTYLCCRIVKQLVGLKEVSSPKETIASGPFILSEYKPEQVVKLVKNEKYFGEKPLIDGIERKIVKDSATRLNLFKNGETDFTTLEKQDWKSVRSDPKYSQQIKYVSRPAVFYILLSGKAYTPFQDREVRKAVAMAIDRQRITSKVLGGIETAKRWLPEGLIPIGPVDLLPPFNPEMAKATLAKTKYKSGSSLPELELMVRSDNADARFVAESIANDLEKNLGLKVKPKSLEWGAMLKARNRGELPSAFLSWYGDYLDPQNFLSLLLTTNASANFDKWSNPEFDKLCASADVEQNEQKRMGLYVEAEKLLMQEVPRIPIYHGTDFILVSNRVEGLRNNLLGMMPHTKVRLR